MTEFKLYQIEVNDARDGIQKVSGTEIEPDVISFGGVEETLEREKGQFRVGNASVTCMNISKGFFEGADMVQRPFVMEVWDDGSLVFHGIVNTKAGKVNYSSQRVSFDVLGWEYLLKQAGALPARSIYETEVVSIERLNVGRGGRNKINLIPEAPVKEGDVLVVDTDDGEVRLVVEEAGSTSPDDPMEVYYVSEEIERSRQLPTGKIADHGPNGTTDPDGDEYSNFANRVTVGKTTTERAIEIPYIEDDLKSWFADEFDLDISARRGAYGSTRYTATTANVDYDYVEYYSGAERVAQANVIGAHVEQIVRTATTCYILLDPDSQRPEPDTYDRIELIDGSSRSVVPGISAGDSIEIHGRSLYGEPGNQAAGVYTDFDVSAVVDALFRLPDQDPSGNLRTGVLPFVYGSVETSYPAGAATLEREINLPKKALEALRCMQQTSQTLLRIDPFVSGGLPGFNIELQRRQDANFGSPLPMEGVISWDEDLTDENLTAVVVRPNEEYLQPENGAEFVGFWWESEGDTPETITEEERNLRGIPEGENVIEIEVAKLPALRGIRFGGTEGEVINDDALRKLAKQYWKFFTRTTRPMTGEVMARNPDILGKYITLSEGSGEWAVERTVYVTQVSKSLKPGERSTQIQGRIGEFVPAEITDPSAVITGRSHFSAGTDTGEAEVYLGALKSFDANDGRLSYQWEYKAARSTTWQDGGSGASLSRLLSPGAYNVRLKVTNTATGRQDLATRVVYVDEATLRAPIGNANLTVEPSKRQKGSTGYARIYVESHAYFDAAPSYRRQAGGELKATDDFSHTTTPGSDSGGDYYEAEVELKTKHTSQIEIKAVFSEVFGSAERREVFTLDRDTRAEVRDFSLHIDDAGTVAATVSTDEDTNDYILEKSVDGGTRKHVGAYSGDKSNLSVHSGLAESESITVYVTPRDANKVSYNTSQRTITNTYYSGSGTVSELNFDSGGSLVGTRLDGAAGDVHVINAASDGYGNIVAHSFTAYDPDGNTVIEGETVKIEDNYVQLNAATADGSIANAGLEVARGDDASNQFLEWNEVSKEFGSRSEGGEFVRFLQTSDDVQLSSVHVAARTSLREESQQTILENEGGGNGIKIQNNNVGKLQIQARKEAEFWYDSGDYTNALRIYEGADKSEVARFRRGNMHLSNGASETTHAVRADRTINGSGDLGFGLTGGGNLTEDRILNVEPPQDLRQSAMPTFDGVTSTGTIRTDQYAPGFSGSGFRFKRDGAAEVRELSVRETLLARELEIRKISFSKGPLAISAGAGTVSSARRNEDTGAGRERWVIEFEEPHGCVVGDRLLSQQYNPGDASVITQSRLRVNQVRDDGVRLVVGLISGDVPTRGTEYVVVASGNENRDSMLYMNPYIPALDVLDGIEDFGDWDDRSPKIRLGKLDGMPNVGGTSPTGYGLWGDNVYLKNGVFEGTIRVTGGNAATSQDVSDAQTAAQEYADGEIGKLGSLAYDNAVDKAKLGDTIIKGGYLNAELISADRAYFNDLSSVAATIGGWEIQNDLIRTRAGTGEIYLSTANGIPRIYAKNESSGASGSDVQYIMFGRHYTSNGYIDDFGISARDFNGNMPFQLGKKRQIAGWEFTDNRLGNYQNGTQVELGQRDSGANDYGFFATAGGTNIFANIRDNTHAGIGFYDSIDHRGVIGEDRHGELNGSGMLLRNNGENIFKMDNDGLVVGRSAQFLSPANGYEWHTKFADINDGHGYDRAFQIVVNKEAGEAYIGTIEGNNTGFSGTYEVEIRPTNGTIDNDASAADGGIWGGASGDDLVNRGSYHSYTGSYGAGSDGATIVFSKFTEDTEIEFRIIKWDENGNTYALTAGKTIVEDHTTMDNPKTAISSSNPYVLKYSSRGTKISGSLIDTDSLFIKDITMKRYGSIRSKDYARGRAGWRIRATGDAEFNNVTIRGELDGAKGTFSGSLTAGSGKITGDLNVDGGKFIAGDTSLSDTGLDIRTGVADRNSVSWVNGSGNVTASINGIAGGSTSKNYLSLDAPDIRLNVSNTDGIVHFRGAQWRAGDNAFKFFPREKDDHPDHPSSGLLLYAMKRGNGTVRLTTLDPNGEVEYMD